MAPDFTTTLRNKMLNLNDENFVYKVDYIGNPKPKIIWYHNGLPIEPDENVIIEYGEYTSSLTIKKILKEDEGEYRARITSFMGEAISISEIKVITGIELNDVKFEDERIIKKVVKVRKAKPSKKIETELKENEEENEEVKMEFITLNDRKVRVNIK